MSKKELNKKDKKTKEELSHKSSNSKEEEKKNLEKNNDDVEELQKRIKLLEKKDFDLEQKNKYYYNILKKNENATNNNFNGSIEDFIEYKRYQNLNGYNNLMIDINDKINDFIEEEIKRDKEKLEYYNQVKNLKDDIDYKLYFMKLLREKERLRDIERYQINKQFYVLKYNKYSREINPRRFERYYMNNNYKHYGNPFDYKSFNNEHYMRPARISKNGIAISNQYININDPKLYPKYDIYDKFKNDYKSHIKNILIDTGSSFFDTKLSFKKKYDKMSSSSSSDNIFSYNH